MADFASQGCSGKKCEVGEPVAIVAEFAVEIFAGIDIGAKSVVVSMRRAGRHIGTYEFRQTPEGHQALIKKLGRQVACVVLEATGIYYLDLAVALHRAGLPVAVINPRSFHHFAHLKLNNSKTDAIDAALLAEYGECIKPVLWQAPNEALMGLRDIGRQINRLTAARTGQEPLACPALEIEHTGLAD